VSDAHRLFLQRGQRLSRLPFGEEADAGIENDDNQDCDGLKVFAHCKGDRRGHGQQGHNEALELGHKNSKYRALMRLGQSIQAKLREPPARLALRHTLRDIGPLLLKRLGER
jgi:hypothetical protein